MRELNRAQRGIGLFPEPLGRVTAPVAWERTYKGQRTASGDSAVWIEDTKIIAVGDAALTETSQSSLPSHLEFVITVRPVLPGAMAAPDQHNWRWRS